MMKSKNAQISNGMRVFTLALSLFTCSLCPAQESPNPPSGLQPHNLFQDHMVIQRDKPIKVWGWSKPGDVINVSFAGNTANGTAADDGKWSVTLPALPANSKPDTLTIKGSNETRTCENVVVGDVWILGGQSNMEWGIGGTNGGNLEIASANFPNIRMMRVPQIYKREPNQNFPTAAELSQGKAEESTDGSWYVCTPENVRSVSAIGYIMARRVHMAAQVPIGIINTARGGSALQTWTPVERMRQLEAPEVKALVADYDATIAAWSPEEDLKKQMDKYEAKVATLKAEGKDISGMKPPTQPGSGPWGSHHTAGICFQSVIHPLSGFPVKGTIFHQGYNNTFNGNEGARMYRAVFPEMIRAWRNEFNDEAMPFLIISLCTSDKPQTFDHFLPHIMDVGACIREAQYQTYLEFLEAGDKNIGFVSTYDLRHTSLHPRIKIQAGERAAAWALANGYHINGGLYSDPPKLLKMEVVNGTIELTYDQDLMSSLNGDEMSGFAIAGADMKFRPAKAMKKDGSLRGQAILVLTSPYVSEPIHYRYAWARNPLANIQVKFRFGGTDTLLPTQRSDNWTNGDLLKALTGKKAGNPANLSRGENIQLNLALEEEDLRRKLEEAKTLMEKAESTQ